MTALVFHHDIAHLPNASKDVLPVRLYGLKADGRNDVFSIGNPIVDKIRRLRVSIYPQVIDFLSIALAVTAADTFVLRSNTPDGWTRNFKIQLPLYSPPVWRALKLELEAALHFLSGDIWDFTFTDNGFPPPNPYPEESRANCINLDGLDCVSLFSGGLDSAIGAIDLLANGCSPLFVSHAYKGDKSRQDLVANSLDGKFSRFSINASPRNVGNGSDITMRTRSLNFLAAGAIAACALNIKNKSNTTALYVPENGFISLNAPLTNRRIGSLSTRTTHPHFIAAIQTIFDKASIPCKILNPYQFVTMGEMVAQCRGREILKKVVNNTVSCSHWKRKRMQCGVCVPCIIRKASLKRGGILETVDYTTNVISEIPLGDDLRDDIQALSIAIAQKNSRDLTRWISESGPLQNSELGNFLGLFSRGLDEVEDYLKSQRIL